MVFGPKMVIFRKLFFQAILARKMSFMIFQSEKLPFKTIKTRRSNSRKIDIFAKGLTHGFGPKMAIFPTIFFFRQYRPGKCILRYFTMKKHLSGLQEVSNVEKLTSFKRGFMMVLVQKWPFLQIFIPCIIRQENVFYDILARKNAFLGYKNQKFKKSKN